MLHPRVLVASFFCLLPIVTGALDEGARCPFSLSACVRECFGGLECIEYDHMDYPGSVAPVISLETILELIDSYCDVAINPMMNPSAWPVDDYGAVTRVLDRIVSAIRGSPAPSPARFSPFVQKVVIPAGAQVAMFGDLHGSVHSFLRELSWLQSLGFIDDALRVRPEHASSFFVIFHGDLVDRGPNGIETLALVVALRLANPLNVFVARGNHESKELNEDGGFAGELADKYGDAETIDRIYALYDALPAAVLLGVAAPASPTNYSATEDSSSGLRPRLAYTPAATNFLLCVHGGLELGFDPVPLLLAGSGTPEAGDSGAFDAASPVVQYALISALRRGDWLHAQPAAVQKRISPNLRGLLTDLGDRPAPRASMGIEGNGETRAAEDGPAPFTQWTLGFMWNDFYVHDVATFLGYSRGRGFIFGRDLTRHWMDASTEGRVVGVVRAHQHNDARSSGPMLSEIRAAEGVYDNWGGSGLVVTLLSGGSIPGMAFPFDAFALLRVPAADPVTWRLQACGQRSEQPFVRRRGQWMQLSGDGRSALGRSEFPPGWDAAGLRSERVCSPGIAEMKCRETPWRAGGTGLAERV